MDNKSIIDFLSSDAVKNVASDKRVFNKEQFTYISEYLKVWQKKFKKQIQEEQETGVWNLVAEMRKCKNDELKKDILIKLFMGEFSDNDGLLMNLMQSVNYWKSDKESLCDDDKKILIQIKSGISKGVYDHWYVVMK